MSEDKPILGSDCPLRAPDRPLFRENRPLSFSNRRIWPRFNRLMPIACPEKTPFSTFWAEDNFQNGLQYAGRKDTGDLDQIPIRMEREYRGPGYRAGRKNYEQDNNPMENHI